VTFGRPPWWPDAKIRCVLGFRYLTKTSGGGPPLRPDAACGFVATLLAGATLCDSQKQKHAMASAASVCDDVPICVITCSLSLYGSFDSELVVMLMV